MPPGAKPELFDKIETEIARHRSVNAIEIAVTARPEDFTDPDTGEVFVMKWLSWKLLDWRGRELSDPQLEVVGDWMTEEKIRADLAEFFPELDGIVHNRISFPNNESDLDPSPAWRRSQSRGGCGDGANRDGQTTM